MSALPPKTSASAAAITDPDPNPFADCDFIVCYRGAKLADQHLAATVAWRDIALTRHIALAELAFHILGRL
jgi:hypothetical protein